MRIRRDRPRELDNAEELPLRFVVVVDLGHNMGDESVVEHGADEVAEQGAGMADTGQVGIIVVAPEAAVQFVIRSDREDDLPYVRWKTWAWCCRRDVPRRSHAGRHHQGV